MDSNPNHPQNHSDHGAVWESEVAKREARKLKARREKHRSIWFGLGMMGLFGWSVAVPTLVALALGIWIDARWPSQYSWTLMLLVVGLLAGCWMAWNWVRRESHEAEHQANDD